MTRPLVLTAGVFTVALAALGAVTSAASGNAAEVHSSAADGARHASTADVRTESTSRFTIAVIPDTQREVMRDRDQRLPQRIDWLVRRQQALDLRFVAQVGDLTNFGWVAPEQFERASDSFRALERAAIPYSIAVGNHDTRAFGWSLRDNAYGAGQYARGPECLRRFSPSECQTAVLLRRTQEINSFFDAERFGAVAGAFEEGKIDNVFSVFSAGRTKWLVLNLELWPRAEALDWANDVVASHPDHNVVVNTHSYTNARNGFTNSPMYGSTSPRDLRAKFVERHPNIRLVVSGHAGEAGIRVDRGTNGNKVVSLRVTFPDTATNPVGLVKIKPAKDLLRIRVNAPATGETYPEYQRLVTGMDFVR